MLIIAGKGERMTSAQITTPVKPVDAAQNKAVRPAQRRRKWIIALILGLIILLAGFLRFYELGADGIGNAYYGATVRSMLTSWKNFFFASYEPGGSVTVDKPPLGLWVQAISAFFLGVNGFALALPQAIAGVLSVPLLFYLVRRPFGDFAGLIAALALAIMPASIATERNNTMDGLLVFVLLLAAWAFIESVRRGRFRYLLLGAFIVGLGFNIKMLQALMPLPAFYLLYFLGAPHTWWKRIAHLAAASVLLIVVSLAWAVAVDLTPAEDRPYVGSSETNSMIELILGHNGIKRLTSGAFVGGDGPAGAAGNAAGPQQFPSLQPDGMNGSSLPLAPDGAPATQPLPDNGSAPIPGSYPAGVRPPLLGGGSMDQQPQLPGMAQYANPAGVGPQDGGNHSPFSQEVGQAGALRLFTAPLVDEASWLLPFALLGLPILILVLGIRWPLSEQQRGFILWAGWLVPELIYFSFTTGIFHAYYVVMLGPPLAALVGATAWALHKINRRHPWRGWILIGLLTATTILVQAFAVIGTPGYAVPIILTAYLLWLGGFALLTLQQWDRTRTAAYALLIASLIVAPMVWSFATTFNPNASAGLPNAGPDVNGAVRPGDSSELSEAQEKILEYLLANTDPDGYLVATASSHTASPYILATGRPVLTFGGFSGGDNVVTVEQLEEMVVAGEIRFVISDGSLQQQKPEIAAWIQSNCSVVSLPGTATNRSLLGQGRAPQGLNQGGLLHDCGSDWVYQEAADGNTQ
jgi:4-amino-4-deoxy-L-arabinose transferase-like glycosyltransferase